MIIFLKRKLTNIHLYLNTKTDKGRENPLSLFPLWR